MTDNERRQRRPQMDSDERRLEPIITTRITHSELHRNYTHYYSCVLRAEYDLLWINTPTDYYTRSKAIATGPRPHTLLHHTVTMIQTMVKLGMDYVVFGPPGSYWNVFQQFGTPIRIRFCSQDLRYNPQDERPSGTYFQLLTSTAVPHDFATCKCRRGGKIVPMEEHVLDWKSTDTLEHRQWRCKAREMVLRRAFTAVLRVSPHLFPPAIRAIAKSDGENFVSHGCLRH